MLGKERFVDGVLLFYHHPPIENAATVMEHVRAFEQHSRLPVVAVNTDAGWLGPPARLRFRVVVLHYSLFGGGAHLLPRPFLRYLERSSDALKVAFFQDEYHFCRNRFEFLNTYRVDAVYSLLEAPWLEVVYGQHTSVPTLHSTIPGHVSDELVARAAELWARDDDRTIDIGYRGRPLPLYMGRGSQEKTEIADRFVEHARNRGLHLDIETSESSRIYGDAWYQFLARCRGVLGVEAGVSVFDLDDSARERTQALLAREPDLSIDDVEDRLLHEYEGNIPYRTISPRHFEAAAFRVVQILYEGKYSGLMEPNVHYLALKKDFSNFEDVMANFADPEVRRRITDRAYDDLIASGRFSYRTFIQGFDDDLARNGLVTRGPATAPRGLANRLHHWESVGRVVNHPIRAASTTRFPGRAALAFIYHFVRSDR